MKRVHKRGPYTEDQLHLFRARLLNMGDRRHSLAQDPPEKRKRVARAGGVGRWAGTTPEQRRAIMAAVRAARREQAA